MNRDEIITAIEGPHCKMCKKVRTRNPSKTCSRCLGERCCFWCRGTGIVNQIEGCGACGGTGKK